MTITRRSWHLQSSKIAPWNSFYMPEKMLIVPRLPKKQKHIFASSGQLLLATDFPEKIWKFPDISGKNPESFWKCPEISGYFRTFPENFRKFPEMSGKLPEHFQTFPEISGHFAEIVGTGPEKSRTIARKFQDISGNNPRHVMKKIRTCPEHF